MKVGEKIRNVPVQRIVDGDVQQIDLAQYSSGKTIILVAVPGAFTPTCSDAHVPGYLTSVEAFWEKGVDEIVILAANDFFVVKNWEDQLKPDKHVQFMADGSQAFAKAADLALDLTEIGLGVRSQRYAAVIRDSRVQHIAIEPDATVVTTSGAQDILQNI